MTYNWIAVQSLIGGMAIAAKKVFNSFPKCVVSSCNIVNEEHLKNYWKNVSFIKYEDYKEKNVDIVVAVPICSGLSMANTCSKGEKARGADAIQNENMYKITDFVLNEVKPKAFIFENAPALATNMGKGVLNKLIEKSENYNYSMTLIKTCSIYHGIPQNRKRTFVVFWKSEKAPILNFYNRENLGIEKYLKNIGENAFHKDEYSRKNKLKDDATFQFIYSKEKEKFREVLEKYQTVANYIDKNNLWDEAINFFKDNGFEKEVKLYEHFKYKRSIGKGFWDSSLQYTGDKYIPALIGKNMGKLLHPKEDRYYSVREQMWFMGLPDDFELIYPIKNCVHITQNVPVQTAYDWISEIKKFLNGELTFSDYKYILHDNYKQKYSTLVKEKEYNIFKDVE